MSTTFLSKKDRRDEHYFLRIGDIDLRWEHPRMNETAFLHFCRNNPDLHIEQDIKGNILIMPPESLESGFDETEIITDLNLWNRKTKLGRVASSQTLFILPDTSKRMPDAAWISNSKLNQLSPAERRSFAHVVPDFVVEIASPSDRIDDLQSKMIDAWMANGVKLAWLIEPSTQQVWIYRTNGLSETRAGFTQKLSGEDILPGFEFDLQIFNR